MKKIISQKKKTLVRGLIELLPAIIVILIVLPNIIELKKVHDRMQTDRIKIYKNMNIPLENPYLTRNINK